MKLLAFISVRLTLLLIFGIILSRHFNVPPIPIGIVTLFLLISLAILFFLKKKTNSFSFEVIAAASFIGLGAYCYANAQPIFKPNHYSTITQNSNPVWNLKVVEVLKPSSFSQNYIAKVCGVQKYPATGKILLSTPIDSHMQKFAIDDELLVFANAHLLSSPKNPYQFHYKDYMRGLGVYHKIQINNEQFIVQKNPTKSVFGIAANLRNTLIQKLKKANFGSNELGVIQALLLGQRADITEETYVNYQKAGAVHILAISGLHMGVLLMLIEFLLQPLQHLPKGKTIKLVVSVLLLWSFAFLAGFSASIVRSATMFSFAAYALYLNRPSNSFNILALSVLFLLLFIDPNLLFQVGFQMSYAAVFAILWLYPLLQKYWFPKNRIVRYFWQVLSVSIAAQLGVLPISLFYFHQFPALFFISNLLLVPALGCILGLGLLVLILASVNWLPEPLVQLYNTIILSMNTIVSWVASQETFVFTNISFNGVQVIASYAIIFSFIWMMTRFTAKRVLLFLTSLICYQGLVIYKSMNTHNKQEVLVLHQTKNTLLLDRFGNQLTVLSYNKNKAKAVITPYQTGENITITTFQTLKNSYALPNAKLMVIDSSGMYPNTPLKGIYLLTQSPQINLDRFIKNTQPKQLIADGSNYKSYIQRWKATCLKHKIPFHDTGEKGFYKFQSVE